MSNENIDILDTPVPDINAPLLLPKKYIKDKKENKPKKNTIQNKINKLFGWNN